MILSLSPWDAPPPKLLRLSLLPLRYFLKFRFIVTNRGYTRNPCNIFTPGASFISRVKPLHIVFTKKIKNICKEFACKLFLFVFLQKTALLGIGASMIRLCMKEHEFDKYQKTPNPWI